jgi:putative transposase
MGIYMEAYQHFVWATRKREPFITDEMERVLYRYVRQQCQRKRITVHALNGMPDHVHLAVTLPASVAPADFIQAIKGGASHFINHLPETKDCLYWQEGYGWLTFALDDLPRIVRYVDRQKERHAARRLSAKMELAADWEACCQSRETGVSGVRAE